MSRCGRLENWSDRNHQMKSFVEFLGCSVWSGCVFLPLFGVLGHHYDRIVTINSSVSNLSDSEPGGINSFYLSFLTLPCSFDTVTGLYDIGFQTDGSRRAMQFEEEATGIAQNRTHLVATPKRCGRCSTILTYWLQISILTVSRVRSHNFCAFEFLIRM